MSPRDKKMTLAFAVSDITLPVVGKRLNLA